MAQLDPTNLDAAALGDEFEEAIRDTIARVERLDSAKAREGWSRTELLGHLLDSACNNHQRFVRAALDGEYRGPGYEQERWVALQGYAEMEWGELFALWRSLNLHLARIVRRIPPESLTAVCHVGAYDPMTLEELVRDYVVHLRHHLRQMEA